MKYSILTAALLFSSCGIIQKLKPHHNDDDANPPKEEPVTEQHEISMNVADVEEDEDSLSLANSVESIKLKFDLQCGGTGIGSIGFGDAPANFVGPSTLKDCKLVIQQPVTAVVDGKSLQLNPLEGSSFNILPKDSGKIQFQGSITSDGSQKKLLVEIEESGLEDEFLKMKSIMIKVVTKFYVIDIDVIAKKEVVIQGNLPPAVSLSSIRVLRDVKNLCHIETVLKCEKNCSSKFALKGSFGSELPFNIEGTLPASKDPLTRTLPLASGKDCGKLKTAGEYNLVLIHTSGNGIADIRGKLHLSIPAPMPTNTPTPAPTPAPTVTVIPTPSYMPEPTPTNPVASGTFRGYLEEKASYDNFPRPQLPSPFAERGLNRFVINQCARLVVEARDHEGNFVYPSFVKVSVQDQTAIELFVDPSCQTLYKSTSQVAPPAGGGLILYVRSKPNSKTILSPSSYLALYLEDTRTAAPGLNPYKRNLVFLILQKDKEVKSYPEVKSLQLKIASSASTTFAVGACHEVSAAPIARHASGYVMSSFGELSSSNSLVEIYMDDKCTHKMKNHDDYKSPFFYGYNMGSPSYRNFYLKSKVNQEFDFTLILTNLDDGKKAKLPMKVVK